MARQYQILNSQSLFTPPERPYLAVFDFGLASGSLWALLVFVLTSIGINTDAAGGTTNSLIQFLSAIYPGFGSPWDYGDIFIGLWAGFVQGFLFGMLSAYFYNTMRGTPLYGVKLPRDFTSAHTPFLMSDGESAGAERPPYTIAIIANPVLESAPDGFLHRDPILNYPKLFQAKVAGIIAGLDTNAMIREKFLGKMRILNLFNPDLAPQNGHHHDHAESKLQRENALCLENDHDITLEPIQRVYQRKDDGVYHVVEERLLNFLKRFPQFYDRANDRVLVDVVYAVSGSTTHTRSSSRFTYDDDTKPGRGLTLNFGDGAPPLSLRHDPYVHIPGMVAYSAWDDRLKTPLHEFAHAMSSTTNGAIHDEYNDDVSEILRNTPVINKHFVRESDADTGSPQRKVPDIFAVYQLAGGEKQTFYSDKARYVPDHWRSYVPARRELSVPCTMDWSEQIYTFDLLLKQFIEDRLRAKTQRITR